MNLGTIPAVTPLLRQFGLEPGRARANARPSPEQVRMQRMEQLHVIIANCTAYNDVEADPRSLERRELARH
jgi:hypothetical protein